jgi:hypothetical protein
MRETFSQKTKDIINESRLIAIELGYDYLSTLHLFLADCKINDKFSVKGFAFRSHDDFLTFYNNQRILLTKEAEKTIRKAFKLWSHSTYIDSQVHPYHLFLAASLITNSAFCSVFQGNRSVYEKLEQYFIDIGQIDRSKINKTFWMQLSRKFFA